MAMVCRCAECMPVAIAAAKPGAQKHATALNAQAGKLCFYKNQKSKKTKLCAQAGGAGATKRTRLTTKSAGSAFAAPVPAAAAIKKPVKKKPRKRDLAVEVGRLWIGAGRDGRGRWSLVFLCF